LNRPFARIVLNLDDPRTCNGLKLSFVFGLPRRLRNPWNLSAQSQLPETEPADAEFAQKGARPSADVAAVVPARRELGLLRLVLV
jgi:hypothetical protein